jgi:cholesterol transport system auxiliary component
MNTYGGAGGYRWCVIALLLITVCACGTLRPSSTPLPTFYTLDNLRGAVRKDAPTTAPALFIDPPHAAAGFDSPRIMYQRTNHTLEYFAHSEWIDTPARMLTPLLVTAIENSGVFRAVMVTPSNASSDLRLATEIVRLQHEFQTEPSRAHFTLRAIITDTATQRVLAWREFDVSMAAASEDPYGGVVAANHAVQAALQQLAQFCAETARHWQASVAQKRPGAEGS